VHDTSPTGDDYGEWTLPITVSVAVGAGARGGHRWIPRARRRREVGLNEKIGGRQARFAF